MGWTGWVQGTVTTTALGWLYIRDPASEFAAFPMALPAHPLGRGHRAKAVLLAINPFSHVGTAVWPCQSAFAVLFAGEEISLVDPTVGPSHGAQAVHVVRLPGAVVMAAVRPHVAAIAVHVVGEELAIVHAAFAPHELPMALFSAFSE